MNSIRGARLSDHGQLQALFEELDRLHRERAPWLLQKPNVDHRPLEWLQTVLASESSALFVADVGTCVGLATVHLRDAPGAAVFIPQQHAVLDNLIVHPDWRGKRIALALYEACEQWALQRKAAWIEANVYEFNADAQRFYASIGLETTMRRMRKPLAGRT